MLVGAFEIEHARVLERCARGRVAIAHDEGMGRAGIEPDIQDVLDLLEILGFVFPAEKFLRRRRPPGIGAACSHRRDDARIDLVVLQDRAVASC